MTRTIFIYLKVALCTAKDKITKIPVYYVTSVFIFISNFDIINLWLENENKHMDTDTFVFQIKSGSVFSSFDIFYSLIKAADIVIYLSFVIINDNVLKYVAVTAKLFK